MRLDPKKKISRRQFLGGLVFTGTGFLFTDSFYYEKYFIEINKFNIGTEAGNTPAARLVQISDLHLNDFKWYHEDLAARIIDLKPDMLLLTGDMVEKDHDMPLLNRFLRLFDSNLRKVAIIGNWERERLSSNGLNILKEIYGLHGCDLLVNQSKGYIIHGKRLMITGTDTLLHGNIDLNAAVKDIKREANHIVLSHCPVYRDLIEEDVNKINKGKLEKERLKIDYMFSGHSHGGQISLFGFAPILPPGVGRYVRGWFRDSAPELYVSKGIGTSIFPVRFGARAEVAVFDYRLS